MAFKSGIRPLVDGQGASVASAIERWPRRDVNQVRLDLTDAQWRSYGVQRQLARYARTLRSSARMSELGKSGGSDFTFELGAATLKVPLDEHLDVYVDGSCIGHFDQPLTARVAAIAAEPAQRYRLESDVVPVSERKGGARQGASGMGTFADSDGVETHFAQVRPHERNPLGGMLEAVIQPAESFAELHSQGRLLWSYSVAADALQQLAQDPVIIEHFTVVDIHRRSLQWLVTMTITGSPESPLLSGMLATLERQDPVGRPNFGASGILPVDDWLRDELSWACVVAERGNRLGGAVEVVIDAANPFAGTERATVYWSYSVPRRFALRHDEIVPERFLVTLVDNHARKIQQRLTISIAGTETTPHIELTAVEDASGAPSATAETRWMASIEGGRSRWRPRQGTSPKPGRPVNVWRIAD